MRIAAAMPPEISVIPVSSAATERLLATLDQHANSLGRPFHGQDLLIEVWDEGTWLGGLQGRSGQSWLFVHLLAVPEAARGQGLGVQLMRKAEVIARERGLVGLWLSTFSWQAPDFYIDLGYEEIGRIPDYPPGAARIFLAKRLDGHPVSESFSST